MDKGLTVPIWVLIDLIVCQEYPKCPRIYLLSLSAQAQQFWTSIKESYHWASVVRGSKYLKIEMVLGELLEKNSLFFALVAVLSSFFINLYNILSIYNCGSG